MANVKISALPAAGSVLSPDQFEVNEAGTSKRVTASQISDFVKSVAPSITQNVGVAFGVQQNNASSRTMIVLATIAMAFDHLVGGAHQVTMVTNASTPNPISSVLIAGGAVDDLSSDFNLVGVIAPGGFYRIDDAQDPDGGNSIVSVWEVLL